MNALAMPTSLRRSATAKPWSFTEVEATEPMQRIAILRAGVRPTVPGEIAARMGLPRERVYKMLGLPRATVERKVRESKPLSTDEAARVLGLARLIGLVERIVRESGNAEAFDAAAWVARWLERPVPALGGAKPGELMDTTEGQGIVSNLLQRVQHGVFS